MQSSYYSAFLISVVLLAHGVFQAQGSPLVGTQNSSVAVIDSTQGRRHHAMRASRRHFRHRRHHKPSHNKTPAQSPRATAKPSSSSCAQYSYKRYVTVNSVHQLLSATKNAKAGDMIELMPGTYYLGKNPQKNPGSPPSGSGSPSRPSHNNPSAPQMATHGTFVNVHGTPTDYITLCGPRDAILDGSDTPNYKGYAIRIIGSSYVRVAGMTVQRALKAIDVQNSVHCEIDGVLTRYTLQEGIRLRYNSAYNIIQNSEITHTGLMWAGYGEGIYVGTSKVGVIIN